MEELIEQYTNANEDLRLIRQNITRTEFETTKHVLSDYIEENSKITEFGAATGRYSLLYAKKGHDVTAVEIAPDQVNILKDKARIEGIDLSVHEGNSISVPFIHSESQDVVLILGPLYHLPDIKDRMATLSESKRILKKGGVVAIAYISRFFISGLFAHKFPELITDSVISELHENGTVSSDKADKFFQVGYFSTPEEIENLAIDSGFQLETHASTDGFGRYIASGINNFSEEKYQTWLKYHLTTCKEKTLLGSSNHGLLIARKRG